MPQLTTENHDGTLVVTITNPPAGYLNHQTTEELLSLLTLLEQDADIRCVIFTGGIEGVFIQHYSVDELGSVSDAMRAAATRLGDKAEAVEQSGGREHNLNQICRRLEALPKPVIAALNGNAMGGGFEFAMACDIRIVQQGEYTFGLPEIHVGILPGAGGTQRLARLVGMPRALEMIMRGRVVGPAEATELGMVHELTEGSALARARQIGAELVSKSPRALAHIKRLVRGSQAPVDPEMIALESRLFMELMLSDEGSELMKKMNRGELKITGEAQ